jgi:hypothetical protein
VTLKELSSFLILLFLSQPLNCLLGYIGLAYSLNNQSSLSLFKEASSMDKHKEEAVHTDNRVSMKKYEFINDLFVDAIAYALCDLLNFI